MPRSVWIMEAGGLANAFGTGVAYAFLVIYLHNVRGFPLATAGLVLATGSVFGLAAGLAAGTAVDRVGARVTLAASLVLSAVGYAALPLVRHEWQAFLFTGVAGIGNGSFWPSQSALLVGLSPEARRHAAYSLQRMVRNLGIGLGGLVGGLIATISDPASFTVLFLVDAVSFLAFVAVLPLVPEPARVVDARSPGRYLDVLGDRTFLAFVGLNVLFVAAGYAQLELLPVFAANEAAVDERAIGLLFFVNTFVVVVAQLPVTKLVEGRRRMRALALMTLLWGASWLLVLVAGAWLEAIAAVALLGVAMVVFAVGECFQGPTQGALVADLAPPRLRGRYMALSAMSWEIGFIMGPAAGGFLLAVSPSALWSVAAAVCLLAGAGALALERGIPPELRLTPA
ncbi:MAG: MFS transporter [Actinomycetota bacterium]|nr:MFS transporter [Actinomycetota bacterium]